MQYPNEPSPRRQEEEFRVQKFLAKKDTAGAIGEIQRLLVGYANDTNAAMQGNAFALRQMLSQLSGGRLSQPDNTTAQPARSDSNGKTNTKAPSGGR
jgi:hypothetical protein